MNEKVCILGAGAFGTAMKHMLRKKGIEPEVWTRGDSIEEKVSGKEYLIFAIPSQAFREVLSKAAPFAGDAIIVNLAKGIEQRSGKRLSEVAEEIIPGCRYVALSGPSHAEEIIANMPTNVCISSSDPELLGPVQELLFSERFRVYTNEDLIGVEIGGAVKNVIALATGISEGMGFGDNTKAAIMTRGLAEISRLGELLGARKETFIGLSGLGDLVVTCDSMHSRNRRCGMLLGKGVPLESAQDEIGQIVEGIYTCYAVNDMAERFGIDMPITNFLYKFLKSELSLQEATSLLLSRSMGKE